MTLIDIAPALKVRKVDELIDLPITILVNKFTEESAGQFAHAFSVALNSKQAIVPIIIDSYGGQVYSLLSMMDVIAKSTKPVATIIMGKAMSCGAMLAACGTEGQRYMSPNATLMLHDVSSGMWGKIEEVKASAKEVERLSQLIFTTVARNVGQPADYFLKQIHERGHADWYLNATDAKEHKLVNHLRIPDFKVKIKVEVEFA